MRSTVRIISIISIISLLSLLVCCNDRRDVVSALDRAEALLITNPDSSLSILDSMASEKSSYSRELLMRYELLYADAQNKAYVDFTTDSTMLLVADYYDHHGTPNEQMRAHYLLGCTYRDMGEAPKAIECYCTAVDKADTTQTDCDLYNLVAVYGQMASVYEQQCLYDEQLVATKHAEHVALMQKDTLSYLYSYETRSQTYYMKGQYDSVIYVENKIQDIFLSMGDTVNAVETPILSISIYLNKDQYDQARPLINNIVEKSGWLTDGKLRYDKTVFYYDMGRLALHDGDLSKAEEYFRNLQPNYREASYKGLLSLYTKLHISDSIAKYAHLYAEANDSDLVRNNATMTALVGSQYRYARYQQEAKDAANALVRQKQTKELFIYAFFILVLLSISIVYIHYKYRKRSIERIKHLVYEKTVNEELIRQSEVKLDQTKLETEQLTQLVGRTNEEIETLKQIQEADIERKNTEISIYKEKIAKYEKELDGAKSGLVRMSFYETEIYKVFKSNSVMRKDVRVISEKEWETLINEFESYFSYYVKFIKRKSGLTQNQLKICVLLHLGFKESEMAFLMNINSAKINKIKIQINDKLFNKSDAKSLRENLSIYS